MKCDVVGCESEAKFVDQFDNPLCEDCMIQ